MPAIDPARLRRQAADLAEWFDRPERLMLELEHLLEFYADRTHRQRGENSSEMPVLLKHYRAPEPALKRILTEWLPRAGANPVAALALADALWHKPIFETRLLACRLLGSLSAEHHEAIGERLRAWGAENEEEELIPALASAALARLRAEAPARFFALVEAWLGAARAREQRLGVRALRALLEETDFSNLPAVFKLLAPLVMVHPASLRPSLLRLVNALAKASPAETAYFLRGCLADGGHAAWVVRHSVEFFDGPTAEGLRQAAREGA
ncbi:MAG: hypothetical protein EPO32_06940 [Anaerolineae bacterium]|nr:MAG: hypothetical protein EPO32_06940 [Anaerolineae bacterium]